MSAEWKENDVAEFLKAGNVVEGVKPTANGVVKTIIQWGDNEVANFLMAANLIDGIELTQSGRDSGANLTNHERREIEAAFGRYRSAAPSEILVGQPKLDWLTAINSLVRFPINFFFTW